jgi:signal transduction histidine kinase
LFVEVLSQPEQGAANDDFYDRLCEAVCRLAQMRRAIIFRYDPSTRRVRAAGAHGLDLEQFASAHVTIESAEIAAEALGQDRVVERTGDVAAGFPRAYAGLFPEPVRPVCPPIGDTEIHLLWTLGKAAALASVARGVSTAAERARQLEQRIDLAREIHEGVIQRLFGVSMALDGDGDLPANARQRCASETQRALSDLRTALQRPLGRAPRATRTTLFDELQRFAHVYPELGVTLEAGAPGDVPEALEPLAQSVLAEAVRNAQKHASPTRVSVRVRRVEDAFVLEIVNDGVLGRTRKAGMGLRLAALEALHSGGVVEFGAREPGTWQVRLVVPDDV